MRTDGWFQIRVISTTAGHSLGVSPHIAVEAMRGATQIEFIHCGHDVGKAAEKNRAAGRPAYFAERRGKGP